MNSVPQFLIYLCLYEEAFLGIYLFAMGLPKKKNDTPLRVFLFFLIYCAALSLQQWLGHTTSLSTYYFYLGIHIVFPFLYGCLFQNGSKKLKSFFALIFASVMFLSAFPINICVKYAMLLMSNFGVTATTGFYIGARILRGIFIFFAIYFLAEHPYPIKERYPSSYYAVMFFAPILNISIMMQISTIKESLGLTDTIGSCILALEFITYYMMWQSTTEYNQRIRMQLINKQMEYESRYMTELKDVVTEYHHLRHDMKNHVVCMDLLLSQGKLDELHSYFYSLSKDIYSIDSQIDTGNSLVNQVLNIKYVAARNLQVPMEFNVLIPSELSIPDHALCSLLSNLLDNALEASEKIADPYILLEMSVVKSYLAIKVTNRIESWQKPTALAYQTTKGDAALHGFGKQIVEKIVTNNEGTIDYECTDENFIVSILLLLTDTPAVLPDTGFNSVFTAKKP